MNLRWSEGQKFNYTQMSTSIMFFMVKSFIAFYLIQYHKNAFHDKLFLFFSILQMEFYFPGFVIHRSEISA